MRKPVKYTARKASAIKPMKAAPVFLSPIRFKDGRTVYLGHTADGKVLSLMPTSPSEKQSVKAAKGSTFKLVILSRKG